MDNPEKLYHLFAEIKYQAQCGIEDYKQSFRTTNLESIFTDAFEIVKQIEPGMFVDAEILTEENNKLIRVARLDVYWEYCRANDIEWKQYPEEKQNQWGWVVGSIFYPMD